MLISDITVQEGVTLRVESGVEILVGGPNQLEVLGSLLLQGTTIAPVVFKSNGRAPLAGDWKGIWLKGGPGSLVEVTNAQISHADIGLAFTDFLGTASVESSSLEDNLLAGLYVRDSKRVTMRDTRMKSNTIGLALDNAISEVHIQANEISGSVIGLSLNRHAAPLEDGGVCLQTCFPWQPLVPSPVGGTLSNIIITENRLFFNHIGTELNAICIRCQNEFLSNLFVSDNSVFQNTERGIFLGFAGPLLSQFNQIDPIQLDENTISSNGTGLALSFLSDGTPIQVTDNSVAYNRTGIEFSGVQDIDLVVAFNDIYQNSEWGAVVSRDPIHRPTQVKMENNYWGHLSGPRHDFLNPQALGDAVNSRADELDFIPSLFEAVGPINQRPEAVLEVGQSIGATGETVLFDGSSSTDDELVERYLFDFGDGVATNWDTTAVAEHIYLFPGTYDVRLWVMDALGVISSDPAEATVTMVGEGPSLVSEPAASTDASLDLVPMIPDSSGLGFAIIDLDDPYQPLEASGVVPQGSRLVRLSVRVKNLRDAPGPDSWGAVFLRDQNQRVYSPELAISIPIPSDRPLGPGEELVGSYNFILPVGQQVFEVVWTPGTSSREVVIEL